MDKPFSQYTDKEILQGLTQTGRQRSTMEKILYQRFAHMVWQRPDKYQLAEDEAVQAYNDAIIAFLRQVDQAKFRAESSLYTYIRSIFIRKCIDIFRAKPSTKVQLQSLQGIWNLPDSSMDVLKQLVTEEVLAVALAQLEQLGERCRKVLLFYAQGFQISEITEKMGFKNNETTYSTKHQCKKKFLEKIRSHRSFSA